MAKRSVNEINGEEVMKKTVCHVILFVIFMLLSDLVIYPLMGLEFQAMAFCWAFILGNITMSISEMFKEE